MQLPYRQTSARGASTSRGRLQFSVHSNDGGLSRLRPVSISIKIIPLFSQFYIQALLLQLLTHILTSRASHAKTLSELPGQSELSGKFIRKTPQKRPTRRQKAV